MSKKGMTADRLATKLDISEDIALNIFAVTAFRLLTSGRNCRPTSA